MRWRLLLILLCWPLAAQAAVENCSIAWTTVADADLAGYRIRWGTTSGVYPNSTTVSKTTSATNCSTLGITTAGTYYMAVNAYDNVGNHGSSANQASFTLSTITSSSVWDSDTDFSGTQGPVWFYQYGDARTAMTFDSGTNVWRNASPYQTWWQGGGHPGSPSGGTTKLSVLRFVAPADGTYNITGSTADWDGASGDGVDVSVVYNGSTTLYARTIANGGGTQNYSLSQAMTAGQTLDFLIDPKSTDSNDSTQFSAHVEMVVTTPPPPPPSPPSPPPASPPPPPVVEGNPQQTAPTLLPGQSSTIETYGTQNPVKKEFKFFGR